MYQDVLIGEKLPGDVVLTKLMGDVQKIVKQYVYHDTWVYSWAEDTNQFSQLHDNGFTWVGSKITTFAEIYSVWFRDAQTTLAKRIFPKYQTSEQLGLKKLLDVDPNFIQQISTNLDSLAMKFTNHYSNYNKDDSWSAISLRGYSDDYKFINKPEEMDKKWKEKHKNETYFLQDTNLYNHFPEIKNYLTNTFDGDTHRVRFMKLQPGGGELERHTDQVDPDCGKRLGQIIRLHSRIITNNAVLFSVWTPLGGKLSVNMKVGECWFLDTRHPHQVINGGTTSRIHLVVDTVITPRFKDRFL